MRVELKRNFHSQNEYHKFYSPNNIVHTDYVLGMFGCIIHYSSSGLQPTPFAGLTQESVVFTYRGTCGHYYKLQRENSLGKCAICKHVLHQTNITADTIIRHI